MELKLIVIWLWKKFVLVQYYQIVLKQFQLLSIRNQKIVKSFANVTKLANSLHLFIVLQQPKNSKSSREN